ncbi:MAG: glycosyltransferase family 4 protein [Methyloligellaceae bacterium]
MAKVAVFGSYPASLLNFRGPLLKAMVNAGHDVHTISPPATDDIIQGLKNINVSHHTVTLSRTGLNPLKDTITIISITKLLRKLQPDNLLAYTIKPVVYGGIAARITNTKFYPMITGLGYAFSGTGKKGKLLKQIAGKLHKVALHQANNTIFQNPDNLNFFKNQGILSALNKTKLVNGSGVDLTHYKNQPFPKKQTFLMIARLLKDKGVHEYVEAARQIRATSPNVKFQLAGWIDDTPLSISRNDLNSWISEGIIDYLGQLDDVRPALSNCTVYVLPSYYPEGIPRTVLEAMSTGRPIITTDMPGCRETVIEHKNGFLVPKQNIEALTQAMRHFLIQPESTSIMGQESRKLAEDRFDVRKVNLEILKTMELA